MTKDEAFVSLIAKTAKEKNACFFTNCGEGREFETDTIKGEDVFGWLIPKENCKEFEKEFDADSVSDKWDDFQCFAIWSINDGTVSIKFTNF